jgi:hypothetical protein
MDWGPRAANDKVAADAGGEHSHSERAGSNSRGEPIGNTAAIQPYGFIASFGH